MTLHVVGNACVDHTFRVSRFPVPGETLIARTIFTDLGGKGLNQAVAAARAGATLRFWSAVGRDAEARRVRDRLREEAIGAADLVALDGPTDMSMIVVDDAGENQIVSITGCARGFDPLAQTDLGAQLRAGDAMLLEGNLTAAVTAACIGRAREARTTVLLNPSPLPADAAGLPWDRISWVVANQGEVVALTGETDPAAGARQLRNRGVGGVVVTLGGDGALLVDANSAVAVPAPRVVAVDTSGGGDVVCGVFASLVTQDYRPRRALAIAVAAASLAVTRPGTLVSCPTGPEIAALHAKLSLERI